MSSVAPVNFMQLGISGCITTIFHPTSYAKVLIQLGHEPLKPEPCRYWFGLGQEGLCYPNVLQYTKYIYRTDGFIGMYKGLLPRLIGAPIGNIVQSLVLAKLQEGEEAENEDAADEGEIVDFLKVFCKQTTQETISRCVGIIASQPFHVIMIRQMAQFVGGEKQYDGLFGSMAEIYSNEGIFGFFSGLAPRLIGEVIQIWLSNLIAHLVNKYVIDSKEAQSYTAAVCGMLISQFTYPFMLVSNVMAVTGAELVASSPPRMRPYSSWRDCMSHLKLMNQHKRGSSQFLRYYKGTVSRDIKGNLVPAAYF